MSYFVAVLFVVIAAATPFLPAQAASLGTFANAASSVTGKSESLKLVGGYYHGYPSYDDYDDDDGYEGHHCGHKRYVKKLVCDRTKPRCFKQRECIWHYSREYCRYVRKCVGGEKYCKWITVPVNKCKCYDCW